MTSPICGIDFCTECGDCIACYDENPCIRGGGGAHTMPELVRCEGAGCERRKTCWRFLVEGPSEEREPATLFLRRGKGGLCPGYIEARTESQMRRLAAQTGRGRP